MISIIQQELTDSQQYALEKNVVCGKNLVALTHDNVAKALAMLYSDASYRNSMDPQKEGTMAWFIVKLSKEIDNGKVQSETIRWVVESIDRDNRTHLNADKCGIGEIAKRLSKLTIDDWKTGLSGYDKKMIKGTTLIDYISEKTTPTGFSPKGKAYKGRKNLSFASKFCHFMCFFRYNNEPERDNFMIWDSILVEALPEYLSAYGIKNYNLKQYNTYMEAVNDLLGKLEGKISRHGLDQLIWSYHRGLNK